MRKCARILGGDVAISFNQERKVFTLSLPIKPVEAATIVEANRSISMPCGTIGVAIDDSIVQRKLLDRFLPIWG